MRDQALRLASKSEFAKAWVNSGRLSVPCVYPANDDAPELPAAARPGAVAVDAPQGSGWLIDGLGREFKVLGIGTCPPCVEGAIPLRVDTGEFVRERYLGSEASAVYLVRPDQVVAARWIRPSPGAVGSSLLRALGRV